MEIENHKEEVPFGHYEALFRKADPVEISERTGAKWDGERFYVNLLGTEYQISHPVYEIAVGIKEIATGVNALAMTGGVAEEIAMHCDASLAMTPHPSASLTPSPQGEGLDYPPLPVQTFLLRYLLEGKQVAWQGQWKTFREMPWGELYIKPYTGRVLTRAAFTFGTRVEAFAKACEKMGAAKLSHGDAGYVFDFLGGYKMQILIWAGDEEFPPNAQVLYSDNFEDGFAPEDRVVAGDILISVIKSRM